MKNHYHFKQAVLNQQQGATSHQSPLPLVLFILILFSGKALEQTAHSANNNTDTDAGITSLKDTITTAADGDVIHIQHCATHYHHTNTNNAPVIFERPHCAAYDTIEQHTVYLALGNAGATSPLFP